MINKENRKNYSKYTNKYIIKYLVNVPFFWLAAKNPKDFLGFCWICLGAFLSFCFHVYELFDLFVSMVLGLLDVRVLNTIAREAA